MGCIEHCSSWVASIFHSFTGKQIRQNKTFSCIHDLSYQKANRLKKIIKYCPHTYKGTRSHMSQLAEGGRSPTVWRGNCVVIELFVSLPGSAVDYFLLTRPVQDPAEELLSEWVEKLHLDILMHLNKSISIGTHNTTPTRGLLCLGEFFHPTSRRLRRLSM